MINPPGVDGVSWDSRCGVGRRTSVGTSSIAKLSIEVAGSKALRCVVGFGSGRYLARGVLMRKA